MNPLTKTVSFRVSSITASVSLAAASNSAGDSALLPCAITSEILVYPSLFIATFMGKYAGGGANPSVTSATNSSLVMSARNA